MEQSVTYYTYIIIVQKYEDFQAFLMGLSENKVSLNPLVNHIVFMGGPGILSHFQIC